MRRHKQLKRVCNCGKVPYYSDEDVAATIYKMFKKLGVLLRPYTCPAGFIHLTKKSEVVEHHFQKKADEHIAKFNAKYGKS